MLEQLSKALQKAIRFRGIPPDSITRIDAKVGFIWFKADETTYFIDIKQADFDLDEYANNCENRK